MLDKSEMDIGNLINGVNDNIIRKIKDTIMDNRTKALKKHNRKISTLKDGRYATYVDDMTKKEPDPSNHSASCHPKKYPPVISNRNSGRNTEKKRIIIFFLSTGSFPQIFPVCPLRAK